MVNNKIQLQYCNTNELLLTFLDNTDNEPEVSSYYVKYLSCVGRKVNKVYIIIFIFFSAILQPAGQIVLLSDVKVKVRIITAEEEGQTLRVFFYILPSK